VTLSWPGRESPVAAVFEDRSDAEDSVGRLRITLPGVAARPAKDYAMKATSPVRALATRAGAAEGDAPGIDLTLKGPLWGFGMRAAPLRIEARTRPRLPRADKTRPLTGLRVMVDAGHGGDDPGALGASGLADRI
jgi:N-acetylmuramoyl-L-alanine amidase